MKLSSKVLLAACALAVVAATSAPAPAARAQEGRERRAAKPASTASPKQQKEAAKKADAASEVFRKIMGAPDHSIPRELLDRAEAVAVFQPLAHPRGGLADGAAADRAQERLGLLV